MNERIKELAEQASGEEYWSNVQNKYVRDFDKEKFAELIIQECMNVLHDNELWTRHVSHVLKEHFGEKA